MNELKRMTVFCGSSENVDNHYFEAVEQLGKELADKEIEVVYGGGNVGLMGALARSVLKAGGKVTGIIPRKIYDNVTHIELSNLVIVDTMHERKAKMYELGDAFIALPGGIGTLEELTEIFTWYQLEYHNKPIGLLNTKGYYDRFYLMLEHMVEEGFLHKRYMEPLLTEENPEKLVAMISRHSVPMMNKWKQDDISDRI
ncbi:TIGR00730 family Rossman fold protein [Guptibacillus hwajinpoensis]|uniref:LOG family protein n=1 Tax=Guptibacillus hwajinpoensis TaxID=208199 RepID=UPI001CFCCA1F|nr:TIGR00730 family Rossman fold protein [Pseudalkalibacillus hwajinpoensis]WLR59355.1 TIGR00730 family Rossman fold protein [Pseudalkalibacillus hwajinpoensis]